jgi:hypothetical protein
VHLVALVPDGHLGLAQLRATYGGFFLAPGAACLLASSAELNHTVGIAWLAAAAARACSFFADRHFSVNYVAGLGVEAAIGAALLI